MNSQLEIKLATKMTDTPETDAMEYFDAMCDPDRVVEADFARKLERERDVAQKAMGDARDILLDAMPDANAPTKILAEMIVAERDKYQEQADALVDRLGATQERMINAEREHDEAQETIATMEIRHAAVMLHTQSIVDDANQCREQRDQLEGRLRVELGGHPESELWGETGLIAATMRCVDALDVVTEQRDELVAENKLWQEEAKRWRDMYMEFDEMLEERVNEAVQRLEKVWDGLDELKKKVEDEY